MLGFNLFLVVNKNGLFNSKMLFWFWKDWSGERMDRMCCTLNGRHNFDLFFHWNNDESFYCLNSKQLKEYWQCVQEDREGFCPEQCDKCSVCDEYALVFQNLLDS